MRLILFAALLLCLQCVKADLEETTITEDVEQEPEFEINYVSPVPKGHVYFAEHFDNAEEFEAKWVRSQAKKDGADDEIAKYDGKRFHYNLFCLFPDFTNNFIQVNGQLKKKSRRGLKETWVQF